MKSALALAFCLCPLLSFAGSPVSPDVPASAPDTRYGLFNLLDHRSNYGQGVLPEPFLVDDSDLETNEFRLDWLHTAAPGQHSNVLKTEIEYGFGLVTVEVEMPVEWNHADGKTVSGFDNIDVGVRAPFYQYVSQSGFVNTTFGAALEVGIPTHSSLSKNTELVPKIFNDITMGSHFSIQSIVGYSALFGPSSEEGEEGGVRAFEYGFVFGYRIPSSELPVPGVQQLIPVFELSGSKELNKERTNELLGTAAIRADLNPIGRIQPRPGVGFVFPLTSDSHQDTHWGIVTSLVFEF
jgi:hypothetical protein